MKKAYIKTYGCQMNVYDSQRISESLLVEGYQKTEAPQHADLLLINTCHIREKASEKLYSALGSARKIREKRAQEGQKTLIGVAGCTAQAEGEEILSRSPGVDFIVGPLAYHRLPNILQRVNIGERVVETEHAAEDKFKNLPYTKATDKKKRTVSAFLTVQEGCDKFCTFCVVPYTRGAEVSRPVEQIVTEAEALAQAGVREITLLGQNVNAWHSFDEATSRQWKLGELLFRLAKIPGIARLRYVTSHPRDMDEGLIAAHRDLSCLMPYLHLPVQSGSDRILKAMNRKHTAAHYINLIKKIRQARPDIALSGDFIVGFPGETEADFQDTLNLVEEVNYAQAYSFKYSPRPGTPGAEYDQQVDEKTKKERLQRLQSLLTKQQQAFQNGLVGKTMSVLLEKEGRYPGQLVGRSPWLIPVTIANDHQKIGDIVEVRVTECGTNSLKAVTVTSMVPNIDSSLAGTQA